MCAVIDAGQVSERRCCIKMFHRDIQYSLEYLLPVASPADRCSTVVY